MQKLLILGGTGNLGKVLVRFLLQKNYEVVVLVRSPDKLKIKDSKLKIIKGDVTKESDLEKSLKGVGVVISVLGHGFRTKYPIQELSTKNLIPLMKKENINRFICVSGAALRTEKDSNSFTLLFTKKAFSLIDPYRMSDAVNQYHLLKKSDLNWTIVRTPVHKSGDLKEIKSIGYDQPKPWNKITRKTISQFIDICITEDKYLKEAPIIF